MKISAHLQPTMKTSAPKEFCTAKNPLLPLVPDPIKIIKKEDLTQVDLFSILWVDWGPRGLSMAFSMTVGYWFCWQEGYFTCCSSSAWFACGARYSQPQWVYEEGLWIGYDWKERTALSSACRLRVDIWFVRGCFLIWFAVWHGLAARHIDSGGNTTIG